MACSKIVKFNAIVPMVVVSAFVPQFQFVRFLIKNAI
ncbi:Protein of unknown function [Lactobacillus gigeriorum DSM 23908 = CRBIP 24.85]|uniref:Uncharacterized protein n=1 Tax=Lactobacillus gigeriorum DSM 23908 = CRBIP 24.85 TaxID=1423751 RepID=I7LCR6_9LACO|nr:Protein of unknown function [Lactobacillus gigeriorum DSM 23908 = CRBIP 24.85]